MREETQVTRMRTVIFTEAEVRKLLYLDEKFDGAIQGVSWDASSQSMKVQLRHYEIFSRAEVVPARTTNDVEREEKA